MVNRFILNETSYHGAGAINSIPDEIRARGFKKILVVTDPGLLKFGVTSKVTDILDREKISYSVFSSLQANPTITNVKDGVEAFKAFGADALIAVGGGSAMDTSKAIGSSSTTPNLPMSEA